MHVNNLIPPNNTEAITTAVTVSTSNSIPNNTLQSNGKNFREFDILFNKNLYKKQFY